MLSALRADATLSRALVALRMPSGQGFLALCCCAGGVAAAAILVHGDCERLARALASLLAQQPPTRWLLRTSGALADGAEAAEAATEAATEASTEAVELLEEQLSRNTQFLGAEGQARVAGAVVAVVGVGGVGSHAAALLARTGVRTVRLIDGARVGASHLRTHAVAARADVGQLKVEVTRRALLRTVPGTRFELHPTDLTFANAPALLGGADMVLLCMPSAAAGARDEGGGCPAETVAAAAAAVEPSACPMAVGVALCARLGIACVPVLSATAKPHPAGSALRIGVAHQCYTTLHDACGCVEARTLAARLRALLPDRPPLPCLSQTIVYHGDDGSALRVRRCASAASAASATATTATATTAAAAATTTTKRGPPPAPAAAAATPCARAAVVAGLGHAGAAAAIVQLAGQPLTPSSATFSRANRDDAHRALVRRERQTFGGAYGAPLDVWPEDLEFLIIEVWGGRCALTGACLGGGGPSLALTRWDRSRPTSVGNLVLLEKARAVEHDEAVAPLDAVPPHVARAIERALERAVRARRAWACAA